MGEMADFYIDRLIDGWYQDYSKSPTGPDEPVICPYCKKEAALKTGKELFPGVRELHLRNFWVCEKCDARVGCYENTYVPFGSLANAALRRHRMEVHSLFDPMWKDGELTRSQAYVWLRKKMQLPADDCHIGLFTEQQCAKARKILLLNVLP